MNKKVVVRVALVLVAAISLTVYGLFLAQARNDENTKQTAVVETKSDTSSETPTDPDLDAYPTIESILRYTNEERAKVGVAPLQNDPRLNQSAQVKADDMAQNDYFNHVDANGKHGYEYIREYAPGVCSQSSENLSMSSFTSLTNGKTIDGFMQSKAHREAMLNPIYDHMGVGVSTSGLKGYVVQHFCTYK